MVRETKQLHVLERSRKGTGFDFWLGSLDSKGDRDLIFHNKMRLEVSGIRAGDDRSINNRVKQKISQTKQSDALSIPALIVVVEFGSPIARMFNKCPQ